MAISVYSSRGTRKRFCILQGSSFTFCRRRRARAPTQALAQAPAQALAQAPAQAPARPVVGRLPVAAFEGRADVWEGARRIPRVHSAAAQAPARAAEVLAGAVKVAAGEGRADVCEGARRSPRVRRRCRAGAGRGGGGAAWCSQGGGRGGSGRGRTVRPAVTGAVGGGPSAQPTRASKRRTARLTGSIEPAPQQREGV